MIVHMHLEVLVLIIGFPQRRAGNNFGHGAFRRLKNLPMGDGGALTSQDSDIIDFIDQICWLGIDKSTIKRSSGAYNFWYEVDNLGYKYQTNDILATVELHMLDFIDEENQERRNISEFYKENLTGMAKFITPPAYGPYQYWDELLLYLSKNNIFPSMNYRSNTNYKVYSKIIDQVALSGASHYETHQITLPIYPGLSRSDLDRICKSIKDFHLEKIENIFI